MWRMIIISKQQIEKETDKAMLIKMPSKSAYKGKSFWHPKKLVRQLNNSWYYSLSFTDDFEFKLKTKTTEVVVGSSVILDCFEAMNETNKQNANYENDEHYLKVVEPAKIEITKVEVDESLKR